MSDLNGERFDSAAACLCERIRVPVLNLPGAVKRRAQEIRLRVGRPVCVCCPGGIYFLRERGGLSRAPGPGCLTAAKADLEDSFRILCGYSVYSHEGELRSGYVTIRGGHRVGVCGTAVLQNGSVTGIRDVSSLNVRVAREIPGSADRLLGLLRGSLEGGLLVAGPPASGKTTVLRDIARQLSDGSRGEARKVAVVDERGEIAGVFRGEPQNSMGACCDVLDGYPKAEGILTAVRSLSPQIVVCDELGTQAEVEAVEQSLNAGVAVVASIHAGSAGELVRRKQAAALLRTGAFGHVALLCGSAEPGKVRGIYRAGDLLAEAGGGGPADCRGVSRGISGVV